MNNTLTDGLQLMKVLAESGEPQAVTELSETLSWPKSHVCRLLKTLVDSGYVEQDARRRYVVTMKMLCLSNALLRKSKVRSRLRPFIEKLAKSSGFNVHLALPANWEPVIADVAYSGKSSWENPGATIGSVNVAHASAAGKVFAAFRPEEGREAFLASLKFEKFTAKTIGGLEEFRAALEKVRQERIAVADGERGDSSIAIGAPVFNAEGELAASIGMHLQGPVGKAEMDRLKALAAETAEAASFALGFPNWRSR